MQLTEEDNCYGYEYHKNMMVAEERYEPYESLLASIPSRECREDSRRMLIVKRRPPAIVNVFLSSPLKWV